MISKPRFMHRYRLNDNAVADSIKVEGVQLTKNWRDFDRYYDVLDNYIKTKDSPYGIVDYEEYNPFTNGVVNSSVTNFSKRLPQYKREVLATMKRPQLVEIAKTLNINPVLKRDAFLINLILEKQEKYKALGTNNQPEENEKVQDASKEYIEKFQAAVEG